MPTPPTGALCAYVVEPEFEDALDAELGPSGVRTPRWPGVLTRPPGAKADPMFARQVLPEAVLVKAKTSEALGDLVIQEVAGQLQAAAAKEVAGLHVFTPHEGPYRSCAPLLSGLRSRLKTHCQTSHVRLLPPDEKALLRGWKQGSPFVQVMVVSRTSALVSAVTPPALPSGGFVTAPWPAGLAPVSTDKQAPSRAYRKLEETFAWLGRAPLPDQTVVDLGGAPGGWAYTALKRGAFVTAVDRAPLAAPAAGHPRLQQVRGDAFAFVPPAPVDWLLCDVICEPHRSVTLIESWASKRWCRQLVVTIKFKGATGNHAIVEPVIEVLLRTGFAFARAKHMHNNHNEIEVFAHTAESGQVSGFVK
ncbi:MAG: SAM-dependent methyltransferase [Deltaproteobacteria bacterium]|nr:SAM-dependent methyltransferase [Deltaproteobacteria bacterium]